MRKFSSIQHFWQIHLIVSLCTAVATGVLAGALIVGDSVRGSLRSLTAERLGTIQHAVLADHFFQQDLLNTQNNVPAILLNGAVTAPHAQTRASKVNILGVTESFFTFWKEDPIPSLNKASNQPFNAIIINEALQTELDVQVGETLLVNIPQIADIHPEFLLGERDAAEAIRSLRLVVSDIVPTQNAGRFNLQAHQRLPFNAFIALPALQKVLGQAEKVNVLFTAEPDPISPRQFILTLEALGLSIQVHENHFDLQSQQYLLKPVFAETALKVATEHGIPALPTLTYLANTIAAHEKSVPYSTIVALLTDRSGLSVPLADNVRIWKTALQENEILLNTWTANDLGVKVGDNITITYYRVGADEAYTIETASFLLKGILPIEGIAADKNIIPDFPGIHDTTDMSEWKSPFPIDYTLIRDQDEMYWDKYGPLPKAFISLEMGKRLWKNRFGDLTAIRMSPLQNSDIQATRRLFETELLKRIRPEQVGFQFLSLQEDGLQAAIGATDFGMLFSSLSSFIIIAVALLIAMLFRIGVEQRSREIGILQAVGYPIAKIRRRFLFEGAAIAGIGSLLGCLLAIGYAQLMIFGVQTWWLPAIGTPFMELYVNPWSLLIGVFIALAVIMISICLTVRDLGQASITALLAGQSNFTRTAPSLEKKKVKALPGLAIAKSSAIAFLGMLVVFFLFFDNRFSDTFGIWIENPIIDFLLLTLGIIGVGRTAFESWLKSQRIPKRLNRLRFALKNAARHPRRSTACVQTVSLACCIIVAVGVNRHDAPPDTEYAFVAESALPLHHNLNTAEGRFEIGFSERDSEFLRASEIIPFRVLPGEDVSCLNLYRPQSPQILGASNAMLAKPPWNRLELSDLGEGRIAAIGDDNSLRWILHHNPDDDFLVQDAFGKPLLLNLETVQGSLFQSQLIISESNFTKYFPNQSGYQFFLVKTPSELREKTAQILEKTLSDYGFDLTSASARLASYRSVENTYISTFQSLGGLGVLLGTFGVALILFRNIIERRGELATLRAFGFRRQFLSWMLFLESCFLLVVGMSIGIAAGLTAVLASQAHFPSFPWISLTITLLLIFSFGIIANAASVAVALRSPLLKTLKSD